MDQEYTSFMTTKHTHSTKLNKHEQNQYAVSIAFGSIQHFKNNFFSLKMLLIIVSLLSISKVITAQDISWNTLPNMPLASDGTPAASNDTALFYIASTGNDIASANSSIYYYSFTNSKWDKLTTVPEYVQNCSLKAIDSCLYVIGGDWFSNKTYTYNLTTGKWNNKENMPTPRQHISYSSVVIDSFIYVIGGLEQGTLPAGDYENMEKTKPSAKNQRYNCKTNQWEDLSPMPTPRQNTSAVVVDSLIYVIGGQGDSISIWNDLKTVEVYNTLNNSWSVAPSLPFVRSVAGAELIDNEIWVLCGFFDNRIYIYNIDNSNWRISSVTTPKSINFAGITSRKGKIYVINGRNGSNTLYNSVYEVSKKPSVSIKKVGTNNNISLFQNPTTGVFTLSFGTTPSLHAVVEIYNLQGELVLSKVYQNTTSTTIDLTGNSIGFYFLQIEIDGEILNRKLCVNYD